MRFKGGSTGRWVGDKDPVLGFVLLQCFRVEDSSLRPVIIRLVHLFLTAEETRRRRSNLYRRGPGCGLRPLCFSSLMYNVSTDLRVYNLHLNLIVFYRVLPP